MRGMGKVVKLDYDEFEEIETGAEYAVSQAFSTVGAYFDNEVDAYYAAVKIFREALEWLSEDYGEYTIYGCSILGNAISCDAEFQEFVVSIVFVMTYHPSTFEFVVGADSEEVADVVEEALAEMAETNVWKYVAEADFADEGSDKLLQAMVVFIENAVGMIENPEGYVEVDERGSEYSGVLTFTVSGVEVAVYFGGELVVLLQEDIVEIIPREVLDGE